MLEHVPSPVGHAMKGFRAGTSKTLMHHPALEDCPSTLTVTSPAFGEGGSLDTRFTADGAGVSPPLLWHGEPEGAAATVIVVEDADSPTPKPLVHLIAWRDGGDGALAEGALGPEPREQARVGLNSFHRPGWLPPDPPPGHGPHRYLFQVFALDAAPEFGTTPPHKDDLLRAMNGHVLAMGAVVGTYARA